MRKKVLFIVLITILLVGLFILTGCTNSVEETGEKTNEPEIKVVDEIKIGEETLKFDRSEVFYNFHYKHPEGLTPDESQKACYLDYKNEELHNGSFAFRIVMLFSEETTLKEVEEESDLKDDTHDNKTVNGIEWNVYDLRTNEIPTMCYATEKDGIVYVVNVGAYADTNIDVKNLTEVFMNGVTLKQSEE